LQSKVVDQVDPSLPSFLNSFNNMIELVFVMNIATMMLDER